MKTEKHYNITDRTGEKYMTYQGYEVEIIEYINKNNCSIKFSDKNGVKKESKRYTAYICFNKIYKHLGTFDTIEEAFNMTKLQKEGYTKLLADKWKKIISDQTYEAMYRFKIEIDD